MKFFTSNLSIHFRKCQNFQTKNKLKELILAKTLCIPKISYVVNLVGGLKLQYQWKCISVLRGFSVSVSVQCSSSNSKNLWCNSLKSDVIWGNSRWAKPCPQFLKKCAVFMLWRIFYFCTNFKGNKNAI